MADVYGEKQAQRLADETWLRDAGRNDWIVLTKDDAIRRRPAELDALIEAAVRVFCLTTAQLRGNQQTERFSENRHRILRQARNPARTFTACTAAASDVSGHSPAQSM